MLTEADCYAEVLGGLNDMLWESQWAGEETENRARSLCLTNKREM